MKTTKLKYRRALWADVALNAAPLLGFMIVGTTTANGVNVEGRTLGGFPLRF